MNLSNRTLLITGANGGLGGSLVRYALEHGAKTVYACARNTADLETLQRMDARVRPVRLDITDVKAVRSLADTLESIDLLINNAGVNSGMRVFESTTADFDVNVQGTLNVCRHLHPRITPGGAIVTVTSILALVNLPIMGHYCASKSALHSLIQAIRAELSNQGIEVYEVLPGPIDTAMTRGMEMEKSSPEAIAAALFAGIKAKAYEIYPDPFSQTIRNALSENPQGVASDFARSIAG